ncbi:MAG: DUF3179 domain-containing protein [Cyclobacteriaceae bacterium]|nr:DUF3179 domain-containing protein [Cyclobacteriaceae bacterium]
MKFLLFLLGITFLIVIEIARVYYIMPFPGSQETSTIELAYFLSQYIVWFRLIGIFLIAYPAFKLLTHPKDTIKWTSIMLLAFWLMVVYAFNFRFLADKMFYQPENKILTSAANNKVSDSSLVLGVVINGEAKAYPIEIIGYHHQVRDTLGGEQVMVTYCTVCRTGRVFKPEVDGEPETFRLVGMDHFNAMFEDSRTKSWWRQANGEAIIGLKKGTMLPEIPSEQMTLAAWLNRYPHSLILQPDVKFTDQYAELEKYDEGKMEGSLEKTDSLSWQNKSWVVGVSIDKSSRAYDWNDLKSMRVINDNLGGVPVMVVLENDSASFHVWERVVDSDTLSFSFDASLNAIIDTQTRSIWNWEGKCIEGSYKNSSLTLIQSYQEFWHSWRTFQPNTTQYYGQEN